LIGIHSLFLLLPLAFHIFSFFFFETTLSFAATQTWQRAAFVVLGKIPTAFPSNADLPLLPISGHLPHFFLWWRTWVH